ncbi:minor histocompatibility antigen H13 [Nematocida sp. LUAm3]|nr:minor histocompatibility antigen H13 [Nematocida sp. LUAm3]KAI5175763.1 minor histocompatibility antigen H13 [Nematocida sp. LUAm2]KAI5178259.1 minor histocompatibility antigen H13 [Nematocida sp. LUAm1]
MYSGVFLISVSSALLLIGTQVQVSAKKRETMSIEDAKMFPIFGSTVLVGLFIALKYLPKDMLNTIFRVVFSLTGILSVYKAQVFLYQMASLYTTSKILETASEPKQLSKQETIEKNKEKPIEKTAEQPKEESEVEKKAKKPVKGRKESRQEEKKEEKPEEKVEEKPTTSETAQSEEVQTGFVVKAKESLKEVKDLVREGAKDVLQFPNLIMFSISVGVNSLYLQNKSPTFSNILACCFTITGLQEIKPDSTKTVLVLLGALFIYDIFWVFCTPVMIGVAKNLDVPIKIVYPWAKGTVGMIGLGDIVIPGLYLGVAREYSKKNSTPWVWRMGYLAYVVSLIITFSVVMFFKKGQPALLYICPLIVGGTMLGAYIHKCTKSFIDYQN